jgi:hypothetical protein
LVKSRGKPYDLNAVRLHRTRGAAGHSSYHDEWTGAVR